MLTKRERDQIAAYHWGELLDFITSHRSVDTISITLRGERRRLNMAKQENGTIILKVLEDAKEVEAAGKYPITLIGDADHAEKQAAAVKRLTRPTRVVPINHPKPK